MRASQQDPDALRFYLKRWKLASDGDPFSTPSSWLQPVRYQGRPAMLKIAVEAEERRGGLLMSWWSGHGAARVLAQDGDALLLERATGSGSLAEMARCGRDDDATRIICATVAQLHATKSGPPPELIPLSHWFRALEPAAALHGGILTNAAAFARELLAAPQDVVVLHGDIHHENILDFKSDGWLAIDPKALIGERGFDYANLFCNPDREISTRPGRLARQALVVADAAGLEPERLLKWIVAWAGLSSAWLLEDDHDPEPALAVAALAIDELAKRGTRRKGKQSG